MLAADLTRRFARRFLAVLLWLAWLLAATARAEDLPRVGIVLAESGPAYRDAAAAIESVLVDAGVDRAGVQSWSLADALPGSSRGRRLLVTIGARALAAVLAENGATPVLALLIPREAFVQLAAGAGNRRLSAVFLDQPLTRQIDAIVTGLPAVRRVGIVVGPESQRLLPELRTAAGRRGLSLLAARADSERDVFAALDGLLSEAEVLLATPDPRVYNAGTLQNVLLASYRKQVPMLGFSPAYLRAGALLTLQSSPAQMAASAADIVRAAVAGKPLPPPRYSRDFSLTVNRHVARSLGIALAPDEELTARLRSIEAVP